MVTRNRFIMFVIALAGVGCQSKSEPEAKPTMIEWRPVGSWSGHGDAQSDPFLMEGGRWRVKWATKDEKSPGAGVFKLTINSAVSGRPLMDAVDQRGVGHDTVYVNEDPRTFYLVIEASGISWSVTVEEPAVIEVPGAK